MVTLEAFMAWLYRIDSDRQLVRTTVSGLFRARDVVAFRQHLAMDPAFDPAFCMLADFTKITKVDILPDEVKVLAVMSPFLPETRRAFILAAEQRNFLKLYELFAMFDAMARFYGTGTIRLFTTQKDALGWLFPKAKPTNGPHRIETQVIGEEAMGNRSVRKLAAS
jgi:hypothetical protein